MTVMQVIGAYIFRRYLRVSSLVIIIQIISLIIEAVLTVEVQDEFIEVASTGLRANVLVYHVWAQSF